MLCQVFGRLNTPPNPYIYHIFKRQTKTAFSRWIFDIVARRISQGDVLVIQSLSPEPVKDELI